MKSPKNRKAEVLHFFINNRKKLISYNFIADKIYNNNVHRYRCWLEQDGINFTVMNIVKVSKFMRPIKYKKFKLKTCLKKSLEIYNKINN